jgi:hypothetical protein
VDQRTEDFLVRERAELRQRHVGSVVVGRGGDWDRLAPTEGALDALVAVGAVSDNEGQLWRGRFREATEQATSEAAPEIAVRDRADEYVAGLLAALPLDMRAGLEDSAELQDVLNALHHVGVFSERDVERWFERLGGHLGPRPLPVEEESERPCRLRELRRVIVGPPQRRGGVRIVGFEVYDDAVVLRWHLVRLAPDAEGRLSRLPDEVESEDAARRAREPSFTLHDDCETAYRLHSGGAGSAGSPYGPRVWSGRVIFTPTLPAAAGRLWAVSEPFQFEVAA